ncbi:MAG: DUF3006 domain-containing protein [Candidatus Falkowbacteria bacterium]
MNIFTATIDRIEEDQAVIVHENKNYTLPLALLPTEVKEGDVINIATRVQKDKTNFQKELAKHLLNEILANDS